MRVAVSGVWRCFGRSRTWRGRRRISHPPRRYQRYLGGGVGVTRIDRDFELPIVFIIRRVD